VPSNSGSISRPRRRPRFVALLAIGAALTAAAIATWASLALYDSPEPGEGRDIVYVVLDRYAGEVTLRQQYGFDNRPFLRSLEAQGFTVADASLCPYQKTAHSLAASLNMAYLPDLIDLGSVEPADWEPVYDLLHGSRVARFLQARGYEYVHVGNWWDPTAEDPSADVNIGFGTDSFFDRRGIYGATPGQFEDIARGAARPGPNFVFAHVTLPHPPYVFDEGGGYVPAEVEASRSREDNYLAQLRHTNTLVRRLVSRLLAGPSEEDPVVVLQADEGPHPYAYELDPLFDWTEATDLELREKFYILNAFYLPGAEVDVPETISPVNTFRLILREYFGAELPLLPDRAFIFRDERHLYGFRDVTARIRGASP
jgi:hypothetical protein